MTDFGDQSQVEAEEVSTKHLNLIALLFFLSGASSLIYQVIWTRQMVFVFGSTTFASATVISAFMAGLALGSFVAGRFADRIRNPFLLYGILEAVIGFWALLAPVLFDQALPIYKMFWHQFHLQVLPFSLLRFAIVSLILLIPTSCMGATLPILSRFVTRSLSNVGKRVGILYAINTVGGVAGTLAGGFCLIPAMGLHLTAVVAAAINLLLATAVVLSSKSMPPYEPPVTNAREEEEKAEAAEESLADETDEEKSDEDEHEYIYENVEEEASKTRKSAVVFAVVTFCLSGALSMTYEVAWTRALTMIIGSTTYAFTIMLATFLAGIFFGSFLLSRLTDKLKDHVLALGLTQLGLAVGAFIAINLFNYLPYWNLKANLQFPTDPNLGMSIRFLLASTIMVPISLFLGASFPLIVKICSDRLDRVGRSVADLYSLNTVAAIIGAFAAGFFIIPYLGNEQTLVCCAAINAILGGILMVLSRGWFALKIFGVASAIIFCMWAQQIPKTWDNSLITTSQRLRRSLLSMTDDDKTSMPASYADWVKDIEKSFKLEFFKDGLVANVAVARFKDNSLSLFTNGHIDASDNKEDMPTQVLLAAIPLILKPDAGSVADIGWGSGVSLGYALAFPIEKLTCAEIEPEVVNAAAYFGDVNLKPEQDKRLIVEFNDGRNYLLATDEKFGVIMSEPSNPWQAGVCNLYTQEYFKICHERLNPGGIFAMWWQSNEVSHQNLLKVFSALKKVFKHLLVFRSAGGDIVVCACDQPLKIDLNSVQAIMGNQRLHTYLDKNGGISVVEDFPLKVLLTDESIDKLIQNVPPNTDDRNYIEFDVSKTHEQKNFAEENYKWFMENAGAVWDCIDWSYTDKKEKALRMAIIAECGMARDNPNALAWAEESYRVSPNAYALCVQAIATAQKSGDWEKGYEIASKAINEYPADPKPYYIRGLIALTGGAPMRARKDLEKAYAMNKEDPNNAYRLAQSYVPEAQDWYQLSNIPMKDDGVADTQAEKALAVLGSSMALDPSNFVPKNPEVEATMGLILLRTGHTEQGLAALQHFQNMYSPNNLLAYKILLDTYSKTGNKAGEDFAKQRILFLSMQKADNYAQNAANLLRVGKEKLAFAALKRGLGYYPASFSGRNLLEKMAKTNAEAKSLAEELAKQPADKTPPAAPASGAGSPAK